MKPCRVILDRMTFSSKIDSIRPVHSLDGSIFNCNSISLRVKRKNSDRRNGDTLHPSKKYRTEENTKSKPKSKALVLVRTNPKPQPCNSVGVGEVILCKMRGFPEWPAIVTGFDNNLVCIKFFGDQTTHKTAVKNVYRFDDSHGLIISHLCSKKKPLYSKAIKEAEVALGVASYDSLLNKI